MDDLLSIEATNEHRIKDLISHWKFMRYMIEQFEADKQQTETKLKALLNHPEDLDGSKTYKHSDHAIRITTGFNHSLNKTKYEEVRGTLNPKFNPVKEVVKYEINKKVVRECLAFGTPEEIYTQSLFITSTPKKLHVAIEEPKNEKSGAGVVGESDPFGLQSGN